MRICSISSCQNKHNSFGYCVKHYKRYKKYGSPHKGVIQERHGLRTSPEYTAWVGMKGRCNNPNRREYKHYGARGIKVCERWINSFTNFYKDMGVKPSAKHSLDRIDFNGNYEPGNCRWATSLEQRANQRRMHCKTCTCSLPLV